MTKLNRCKAFLWKPLTSQDELFKPDIIGSFNDLIKQLYVIYKRKKTKQKRKKLSKPSQAGRRTFGHGKFT